MDEADSARARFAVGMGAGPSEPGLWDAEQLVLCHDRELGFRAVIAVDDTRRGPALGGVRFAAYPSRRAAAREARRLAAAMTLKNAAAELPYGGGKAVILADGPVPDRAALMRSFGRFVARLDGTYLPGVDMGTTVGDLAEVGRAAPDVACYEEDPSPATALGVFAGIRAALRTTLHRDLDGVTVAVQGAGHVGSELARLLRADGARVLVADVDPARAAAVAAATGATVVAPDRILDSDCDVLAPCAGARLIDSDRARVLRCAIVAGAANDTLADRETAHALHAAGVVYVPDFLLNAGGVIHIHALRAGFTEDELRDALLAIGDRVRACLDAARDDGALPLEHAERRARDILDGRVLAAR